MAKAIGWVMLGVVLGLIGGGAVAFFTPDTATTVNFLLARHAFCFLLGGGFGAIAGAILGSASAIIDAIDRGKHTK